MDSPKVEVVIEIPRWSFLKRGTAGHVDFVSPFPCPFNYGSVPTHVGLEGDLLDALVLGPRLTRGSRVTATVVGSVGLTDRGLYDDKLICIKGSQYDRRHGGVLLFFHFYALCKRILNFVRRQPGATRCEGWGSAVEAIARARPRDAEWQGPDIPF